MNVLAIGAHPDDIELGCGGALLRHRDAGDRISLLVMTLGERGPQDAQEVRARVHEQEDAAAMLGADVFWGGFEDGAIPSDRPAVELIEKVLGLTGADVVYVHGPNDSHQDHRSVSSAASAACRRMPRVCFYESPSTTRFDPSFFVDIGSGAEAKLDLIRAHVSQVLKNGMVDLEAIEASARYRGFQARTRFAEAFELGRFTWPLEQRRDDSAAVEDVIDLRNNLGVEKEILV